MLRTFMSLFFVQVSPVG